MPRLSDASGRSLAFQDAVGDVLSTLGRATFDLEPVLGNLAEEVGLHGMIQYDGDSNITGKAGSNWVILSRQASTLDRLVHEGRWPQWQSEQNWPAAEDAIRIVSALPDAGGSLHANGNSY